MFRRKTAWKWRVTLDVEENVVAVVVLSPLLGGYCSGP